MQSAAPHANAHTPRFVRERPALPIEQIWTALMLVSTLAFAGCSKSKGPIIHPVQGSVTLNAAPLKQGSIQFIPKPGTKGPSAGAAIVDGKYFVPQDKGLREGVYRVEIRSPNATGRQIAAKSPFPPGTTIPESVELIPNQFNSASTLEIEIPAIQNQSDFDL